MRAAAFAAVIASTLLFSSAAHAGSMSPARIAAQTHAVRISPRAAVLTLPRLEQSYGFLVHGPGGWQYPRRIVMRPRIIRATVVVRRSDRNLRLLIVSGARRARVKVWLGGRYLDTEPSPPRAPVPAAPAAPDNPCGPLLLPAPGERPPACWRPYASDSPFNLALPAQPRLDPHSNQIVGALTGRGLPQALPAGWAGTDHDWGRPVYFARAGDPSYTLHCTRDWGRCPIEGTTVRIPRGARPAGGDDAHMTVIDPASGWEYGFWEASTPSGSGGRLSVGYGARSLITGSGIEPNRDNSSNAAGFGGAAGLLRAEELAAGQVDHALLITVLCDSGDFVYPAVHSGSPCPTARERAAAPAMGQRFQLDLSDAEIAALNVPDWKRALLRAMAHYGMVVGDTGGDSWAIAFESGVQYTSFGRDDAWVTLAQSVGLSRDPDTGTYGFPIGDDVDWAQHLRVVAPCVSARNC